MFETDDDDFFPSPSSKLSSIFNAATVSDDSNASLTYKAPKQPKPPSMDKKETEPGPNSEREVTQAQSSVILAKVVTLWKLDNGKNKAMGKYMVAIIGNASKDLFEIIVYQEKTKFIIRETLGQTLTLYKYPNNFVTFYDSIKQLWTLNFDSLDSKNSFLQHASHYNCVIVEQSEQNIQNERSEVGKSVVVNETDNTKKMIEDSNVSASNAREVTEKERILSRITKMGQPILPRPVIRSRSSELSDSETESSYSDSRPIKPVTAPRKFKRNSNNQEKALAPITTESNNNKNFNPHIPTNNHFVLPGNQMMLNTHSAGVVYSQPLPDYSLSNFIIAQNAELKTNLAEINMKLNNALSRSDNNGNNSEDVGSLKSKIKCQNLKIDNLSTELQKSKQVFEDLKKKYDEKCKEVGEEREKSKHSENFEHEIKILQMKSQNLESLQNEVEQMRNKLKEKDKQIEDQNCRLKSLEESHNSSESLKEGIIKENADLKLKLEEMTLKIKVYEEEVNQKNEQINAIENQIENKSLDLDRDRINKVVKESMNEAFRSVMENFNDNESYEFGDIQQVLLENLKRTSYKLMNAL